MARHIAPSTQTEAPQAQGQERAKRRVPTPVWLMLIVLAALAGYNADRYLMPQQEQVDFGQLGGVTVLTAEQLDMVVGSYVLDGEVHQITALEAMVQESSPDQMRNEDGTYIMPSAESVLSAARTAILMREVETRGIEVSEDEYLEYVVNTFGTDDFEELAREYNMNVETVQDRLHESAAMAKLRAEVVSAVEDEPVQPTTPKEGEEEIRTKEFAEYIIKLAGDEWDEEQGAWVNYDGPYAAALREYDVRSDSASYYAAQIAYNVAYQLHSDQMTAASAEWTDYVNGLLCEASLAMSSVVM